MSVLIGLFLIFLFKLHKKKHTIFVFVPSENNYVDGGGVYFVDIIRDLGSGKFKFKKTNISYISAAVSVVSTVKKKKKKVTKVMIIDFDPIATRSLRTVQTTVLLYHAVEKYRLLRTERERSHGGWFYVFFFIRVEVPIIIFLWHGSL